MLIYLHAFDGLLVAGAEHCTLGCNEGARAIGLAVEGAKFAKRVATRALQFVGEGVEIVLPHLGCHILAHAFVGGQGGHHRVVAVGGRGEGEATA